MSACYVHISRAVLPFESLVLHFTVLIRKGFQETLDDASSGMRICLDVLGGRRGEDVIQVAQLHETNVGIGVIQLGEQGSYALGSLTAILCHVDHLSK